MPPFDAQMGDASRLMAMQAVLVVAVAAGYLLASNAGSAQAAAFGGVIALLGTYIHRRRVRLALAAAKEQPGSETTVLMVGVVQRYVLALAMFALGMGVLKLQPVPMLLAFAVGQGAFFLTRVGRRAG